MHASVCTYSSILYISDETELDIIRRNEKAVLLLLSASKAPSTMLYPFYLFPSIVS